MVKDSGQISFRIVWLTIVHVCIALYVGVGDILLGAYRRETASD